jgi:hypothetical protein
MDREGRSVTAVAMLERTPAGWRARERERYSLDPDTPAEAAWAELRSAFYRLTQGTGTDADRAVALGVARIVGVPCAENGSEPDDPQRTIRELREEIGEWAQAARAVVDGSCVRCGVHHPTARSHLLRALIDRQTPSDPAPGSGGSTPPRGLRPEGREEKQR